MMDLLLFLAVYFGLAGVFMWAGYCLRMEHEGRKHMEHPATIAREMKKEYERLSAIDREWRR